MLRNRSRAVTSKPALMADHGSQSSSTQNYTRPTKSFFNSPRFRAFTTKSSVETEALKSPTSILDPKSFFNTHQFWQDTRQSKSPRLPPENKRSWDKLDQKGIGVALVDTPSETPIEDHKSKPVKPGNKMVLFGAKLQVQIPHLPPSTVSPTESPKSPADFGIKTRNSQLTGVGSPGLKDSSGLFTGYLPVSEMELSEDYTCVISRGPNPKTTHIFDNCIVESYYCLSDKSISASDDFLSFCHTCKKTLDHKDDIYIYRGEQAFCSHECRYQEMLLDGMET